MICYTDIRDTILLPCRHLCICSSCGKREGDEGRDEGRERGEGKDEGREGGMKGGMKGGRGVKGRKSGKE